MVSDIAMMRQALTERLKEKPFISGPASDTPLNELAIADRRYLLAFRALLADGIVTETPSHFRARGYWHSWYRLKGGA